MLSSIGYLGLYTSEPVNNLPEVDVPANNITIFKK